MKADKRILIILVFLLLLFLICSCTDSSKPLTLPYPSLTFTQSIPSTSISTIISSASIDPTKTYTPVPPTSTVVRSTETVTLTPVCNLSGNIDKYSLLHDYRVTWTDMGIDLWSQVKSKLNDNYPEFSNFHQTVYYQQSDKTVEYDDALTLINQASGWDPHYLNPFIILVTVGERLNWEPPPNGDLYHLSKSVRDTLLDHYRDYERNTDIRSQNPSINNAATYMIYAYFESDMEDMENWCKSYLYLIGQDPATNPFEE